MTLRSDARIRALYQTEDKAVEGALDLLFGAICECGHLNDEHCVDAYCSVPRCPCAKFRPVRFTVERAK